ncbi:hypothetical protein [Paenibacillus sp.]|uniref:hypothetical protein n=1 Tax=Paenibacillus sp. TaxID=58172 RepID=UPI002D323380|nr:hypothetical protein [Paenibacillus sp.]HZG87856.1 hypothetical protein [Paenibacillus sp.]
MERTKANVEWEYEGKPDFSSGTGATRAERTLALVGAFAAAAAVLAAAWSREANWNAAQLAVAAALAFDVGGGLVSNALNSCKRFYHTPAKPEEGRLGVVLKSPALFSAAHVHPIAAALVFEPDRWASYGLAWYALLMLAVFIVLRTPLYLRRPVSFLAIMLAAFANFYAIPGVTGMEWLVPLLFVKIVYGHLVREEPYRPT